MSETLVENPWKKGKKYINKAAGKKNINKVIYWKLQRQRKNDLEATMSSKDISSVLKFKILGMWGKK